MSSCLNKTLTIINYIASGILILVALAMAILFIFMLATSIGAASVPFNVLSLVLCILIIAVGVLGIWATKKQVRIALGIFSCVAGVIFVIFFISAAVTSAAIGDSINYLASFDSSGLNNLPEGTPIAALYSVLMAAYQSLYLVNSCQGPVCKFSDFGLTCSSITCASNRISDDLTAYLSEGAQNGGVTQLSLNACLENIGSSGDSQGADVDTAWCISNTAFIAVVDDWAIGVLIGVWIITVLVLLLSVSNGALACTIRKKQVKGGVILATPAEVPQTSHSSGEEAEKQVVNSV
ncbi:hypothetical protein Pmar_PMAR024400 [Perkinsus marinus ATCC 50983]|uniref:Uncharacterized protein n=1 Tax=Perkinsus marinus (strain ATCC 50983 / TXsc) TaxID=423536 RepID=C5KLZ8_PERM5|nr:hypothetical protein Pmar_PMAR024400 [Perkinsus marinus ATCC 50983]EER14513.1 hypothetical protein Pmar_PMAR024400 [Perkinsus marinus ATCC 50983]|eukprot:XP_002782718.1 hypothetical protein Pmar_PMAR024400 [Perkinsus marinus ATCC 50983]